jgi:nitroreductase
MHKVIRRVLGMPEDRIIVAGMSLGYEDESARVNEFRTDRLPVDEFAYFYGF